jgi:hypothetical protein
MPDDPWPKITPLAWADDLLTKAVLPFTLEEIAEVLARCLELEMRAAGECAAMAEVSGPDRLLRFELRLHSRVHGEAAARLLTAYETVYQHAAKHGTWSLLSPAQLKEEGTLRFQEQFLDLCGRHLLAQMVGKKKASSKKVPTAHQPVQHLR